MATLWGRCNLPGVQQIYYRDDGKVANRECCIIRRYGHMVFTDRESAYVNPANYLADLAVFVAALAASRVDEYFMSLIWVAPQLPGSVIVNGPLPPNTTLHGAGVQNSGEFRPPTLLELQTIFTADLDFLVQDAPNVASGIRFFSTGTVKGATINPGFTLFKAFLTTTYPMLVQSDGVPQIGFPPSQWLLLAAADVAAI